MHEHQHEYIHGGTIWHLGQVKQHLVLRTPYAALKLPLLEPREHSEELRDGRISQVYHCDDGWCLKINVIHQQGLQVFQLEFSKDEIELRFPNTPPGLCVDLLEMLAARSAQIA